MSTKKKIWEQIGISKGAYYRAIKQGRDPKKIRPRRKKGDVNFTPLAFNHFSPEEFLSLVKKIVLAKARGDQISFRDAEEIISAIVFEIFTRYGKYRVKSVAYIAKATHRLYLNERKKFLSRSEKEILIDEEMERFLKSEE